MPNMFDKVLRNRQRQDVPSDTNIKHVSYNGNEDDIQQDAVTTTTYAAQRVEDFKQYTTKGRGSAELKRRIALFLAKLVQATTVVSVKRICADEKAWFLERYSDAQTRANYMTPYRHAIQACFADRGIPTGLASERETTKGLVVQHVAMDYMLAPAEDYETARQRVSAKTNQDQDNSTPFDMNAALEATEAALKSDDWREVMAGLIMAVQVRPSDAVKLAAFKAVSKYRLAITTGLKKRGKTKATEIWCLVDTALFIDALERSRRDPNVLALKDAKATEIDSRKNSTINRAVRRVYGAIIPPPVTEKELSAHNLRAAGTNIGYHLYGEAGQKLQRFVELQLVHDNKSAAANYDDYYCVDANGQEITAKGLRPDAPLAAPPKSRTSTRPTLDKQMVEQLHQMFEGATTKDCIIAAIARAQQSEQLRAENERLQRRLQAAEDRIEVLKHQTHLELIHVYPDKQSSPPPQPANITDAPNADLIGSKRSGASDERIRRSVAAIKDFNEGKPQSEQIAINAGSLRKLARGNAQTINAWVKEHKDELEAYATEHGHGYRQNVGKDLSVIKWDEDAYGAYEWPEGYF